MFINSIKRQIILLLWIQVMWKKERKSHWQPIRLLEILVRNWNWKRFHARMSHSLRCFNINIRLSRPSELCLTKYKLALYAASNVFNKLCGIFQHGVRLVEFQFPKFDFLLRDVFSMFNRTFWSSLAALFFPHYTCSFL